jgi:hypothetical protein
MDGDQSDRQALREARPRALPLARAGIPAAAPHLRLAPQLSLPHPVESRTADAILARMLIGDGALSEAEARASEATARELDLPLGASS